VPAYHHLGRIEFMAIEIEKYFSISTAGGLSLLLYGANEI